MTSNASKRRITRLYSEFLHTTTDGHSGNGLSCLRIILRYHDSEARLSDMVKSLDDRQGMSLYRLSTISEELGLRSRCINLTPEKLIGDATFPCIVETSHKNFTILFLRRALHRTWLDCLTPGKGVVSYTKREFVKSYSQPDRRLIPALLLEPADDFFMSVQNARGSSAQRSIVRYFMARKKSFGVVLFSLLIASFLQMIIPFLMQAIVDVGINTKDFNYITLILFCQLFLILSRASVEFFSNYLLLHASTVINVNILSDFWIKLSKLPVFYFDRNHIGQILQRINDSREIQQFLNNILITFYFLVNFIVFSVLLLLYKLELFLVLFAGFGLYSLWIFAFLGARKKNNQEIFQATSRETNIGLQYLQGMPEIRLHNDTRSRRWEWEGLQALKFNLFSRRLRLEQLQRFGGILISQGKDMLLTYLVARLVIHGELSFGAMMAIIFIVGQLSAPIDQFIIFIKAAQDARISLDRLNDIHHLEEESLPPGERVNRLPKCKTITLDKVSFAYPNAKNHLILDNVNLKIPENQTTAIVGVSGSGKTTLLKILLKFLPQYQGDITIANTDFKKIDPSLWRDQCGAVLQDGYIFNDTITKNIAVGYEEPDYHRLKDACRMVNILSFIESLSNGFETMLGAEGMEVSQGQKQRILIARVIYKNPKYLFFDESTNALDARNERQIWENLEGFFRNKTVIVVAHRLSTVRNADNIVVIDNGRIVEQGNHSLLSRSKGHYFELVKNQLELGN
jgi:ATP-binding cassette subfamily B protein